MGNSVTLTGDEAAVAAGLVGMSVMMMSLILLAFTVLLIIARWKIFTKAGEKGWKSIIPIYSDYVQWRIGWKKTSMFWIMLILLVAGSVLMYMGGAYVTDGHGHVMYTGGGNIWAIIGIVLMIVGGILNLVAVYKLFASYGRGVGWFIGYIFVPHIMLLVLGFGSSRYFGPQD